MGQRGRQREGRKARQRGREWEERAEGGQVAECTEEGVIFQRKTALSIYHAARTVSRTLKAEEQAVADRAQEGIQASEVTGAKAMGSFTEAVEAISVSTELVVEELTPHLDILLTTLQDGTEGAAEWIAASGILCTLAQMLRTRGPLTLQAAQLVAELSGHAFVREHCIKAGLAPTLLGLLACGDQELLLHVIRALGRICLADYVQQELLVRGGALPSLVETMQTLPENPLLVQACLQALCSLADMGEDGGLVTDWNRVASLGGDEYVYWGMPYSPYTLLSMVMVVRLNQCLQGHHSVAVERVQRCSPTVWSSQASRAPPPRSSFIPRGVCFRSGREIVRGVWNTPRFSSLRTRVFHTLL